MAVDEPEELVHPAGLEERGREALSERLPASVLVTREGDDRRTGEIGLGIPLQLGVKSESVHLRRDEVGDDDARPEIERLEEVERVGAVRHCGDAMTLQREHPGECVPRALAILDEQHDVVVIRATGGRHRAGDSNAGGVVVSNAGGA